MLTRKFGDDGETSGRVRNKYVGEENLRVEIIDIYLFFCEARGLHSFV
jgi:hypothetical protein